MANLTYYGREIGVFGYPANLEVKKAAPLDARQVCKTKEEKYELEYNYKGMIAIVTEDSDPAENGLWICTNPSALPTAANPGDQLTGDGDWEKAGGGSGGGDPVEAFTYFTTQEQITAAITNGDTEAEVTSNAIDLSTEGVDISTPGQILIESSVNQEDYSDEFNGNYILDQNGDLILCSAEPMDPATYVTTVTFDGEIDPATDFTTPLTVTSSTLELNDLVIRLESGQLFKVNIQSGGGQRTYQPHDFNIPIDTPVLAGGIGGIKANETSTSLTGLEYDEMWNKLLFPAVAPVPGGPSVSVSITPTNPQSTVPGLFEVGYVWQGPIDVSGSRGTIATPWPGSAYKPQGPRSDGMTDATLTLFDGSTVNVFNDADSLSSPYNFTQGYQIKKTSNDGVTLEANFLPGPQPVDNTGADSGSAYGGGPKEDSASPFSGAWPIYVGTASGGWEKATDPAATNTTPVTGGTSSNLLWQTPFFVQGSPAYNKNTGEFSQNFTDVPTGARHRVAVHEDYVSGPFEMQERDFSTGNFQASTWTYKNTITFDVNSNAQGQVYHIMEYGAVTASGGDDLFQGNMRCKYRIKSA